MPELPEVETVVRGLRPHLLGQSITAMWWDWYGMIHTPTPEAFQARVVGQRVEAVTRRAKYIVLQLTHDFLLIHLKMTGRLYVCAPEQHDEADTWLHVQFGLSDGRQLRFSDSRKFGKVYLVNTLATITGKLGPEPLDEAFTADVLKQQLGASRRPIKAALLDQSILAGVGNIYADEALHRAHIHPLRPVHSLSATEISVLHRTIRAALSDGIAREGASINWYRKPDGTRGEAQDDLFAYGRTGQPCRTCGSPIHKIEVAQRGTHFCPTCQPLPTQA